MNYKTIGIIGGVAAIAGYIKIYTHTNSLSPLAGSYCGSAPTTNDLMQMNGHCWGCGVMPLGILLLAIAIFMRFRTTR